MTVICQDPRLQTALKQRHGDNFHERSLIVCSGLDMVNITCTNIIFKDVNTAQVFTEFEIDPDYLIPDMIYI